MGKPGPPDGTSEMRILHWIHHTISFKHISYPLFSLRDLPDDMWVTDEVSFKARVRTAALLSD